MAGLLAGIGQIAEARLGIKRDDYERRLGLTSGQAEADRGLIREEEAASLKPILEQFGPGAAKQVGGLLTSGNAQAEALGAQQLQGLLGQVQGQEFQQAGLDPVQRQQLASSEASTRASNETALLRKVQAAGVPIAAQQARDTIDRQIIAQQVGNRKEFQTAVQGNEAISAGVNGVKRFQQLGSTLNDPNATQLDILNAAVFMTQIIEPGLATRNDDRMAVREGSAPGLVNFSNTINQFLSGSIDRATATETIMRSATNIMQPLAAGTTQALDFWRGNELTTPGVEAGSVNNMLGLDPVFLQTLSDLGVEAL